MAVTGAHRAKMDPTLSPACPCGAPIQDVHHLVYKCELLAPPSPRVAEWGMRQPAFASALLCPPHSLPSEKKAWIETCQRAIRVLTQDLRVTRELDWKGHDAVHDSQGRLAYWLNCFTSRKIRDQHFIASSPCPGRLLGEKCAEGSFCILAGHIFRCHMRAWKRASARPCLECQLCGEVYWPGTITKRMPHYYARALVR